MTAEARPIEGVVCSRKASVSDRFVVEADRKVVGIAVRVPGGFKFFSSDPDYLSLEGKLFARAKGMARRVAEVARRNRKAAPRASAGLH